MIRVLLAVLLALLVAPRSPSRALEARAGPIRVMTSITPLADVIGQVGGDRVEAAALVPVGDEPETYEPVPSDVMAIARARIFFANGLGLEPYLDGLVEASGNQQLQVVTLSEGLPTLGGFGQGSDEGGNPHLWLDPRLMRRYVEVIRDTLGRVDPSGAAVYTTNADRYVAQLAELDAYVEQQIQTIPPAQRVLVSTHDVYPYFADRYGMRYLAVVSANPEADPSAREYAELVRTVRDHRVKAVFGEAGFSEQFISQLAADTGATYVADLYTDTLTAGPPAETYLNAMRHNADRIVGGLQ